MKRQLIGAVSAIALGLAATTVSAADKVNVGTPNWVGAQAVATLIKILVEEKLGGEANLVSGTNATIWQAMDRGKGDIQVHPDVWLPNQQNFADKYVKERGTVILSENHYDGQQGFCVSTEFQKKTGITSIYDLTRPDVAAQLDNDGNGKGEIWIGAQGWASTNVNHIKVRDYGLLSFMEPIKAEETVNMARVADRISKGEGVALYCYSPHATMAMFDLYRLEEPAHDPAKYKVVQPTDDPQWFEKSKVETGDAPREVQIAYSKDLVESAPRIAELLSRIALDADTMSDWSQKIINQKRQEADVVKEWIEANPDRVDSWLGL